MLIFSVALPNVSNAFAFYICPLYSLLSPSLYHSNCVLGVKMFVQCFSFTTKTSNCI